VVSDSNKILNAERLQKLESIAFAWSAKHVRKSQKKVECPQNTPVEANTTSQQQQQRRHRLNEAQWEDMYQRLLKYKEQHGNCLVPRKYEQDPKLATWVETQRVLWNRDYRKQETPTPPPEALEPAISGDEQQPPETVAVATTNDLLVEETKIKRLTPERKQKLDQLGFVWSLRSKRIEDHWDEMFRQLVEYKSMHGDCLVPSRYEANLKLGKVRNGRARKDKFSLPGTHQRTSSLFNSGLKLSATNTPSCNGLPLILLTRRVILLRGERTVPAVPRLQ
jgi:hypothetical protein